MNTTRKLTPFSALFALALGLATSACGSSDCGGNWKNFCGSEVCDRLVRCCDASAAAAAECKKNDDDLTTTKNNNPLGTPQQTIDSVCSLTLTQANCQ